ncbi:MAG TPA: DegT/DnrJ/EryC1/StrS family aminotransferase [Anaerolineae bacterium]|nr:DegT/DnrJ/EryC1/StrS family aminotransferase [Anaerolineae bacterium]
MIVPFVDLFAQHAELRAEIDDAIGRAIDSSAFIGGPALAGFEAAFAGYCGAAHAVGVSDGTHALILALRALGVMPGDLVLTVSHTFIATAEAIVQCGADPVFLEIDAATYTLDPQALAAWLETHCERDGQGLCRHRASSRRVAAIVPVHLYGLPADMAPILALAQAYNLLVIEDACQAHGAWYTFPDGRRARAGSMGHAGCFSFYPGKNLGAMGEAGAVVTEDAGLAQRMRILRDHGQSEKYVHQTRFGVNARLDAIQAGVLAVKLQRLDAWNDRRRRVADFYREHLRDLPGVCVPVEPSYGHHVYHLFVILVAERDRWQAELRELGVATGLHYPIPVHLQQAFADQGFRRGDLPVTERVADTLLSLPMFPHLSQAQAEHVVQAVRRLAGQ